MIERIKRQRWNLLVALWTFAIGVALVAPVASTQGPTANAGPDRTILVNETLVLDGTASSGGFDGLQADGRHSYRWDFGYGNWTYEGGLLAPVAYPTTGSFTVTLTVCTSGGTCSSDTATITVNPITEGTETVVGDTGNPVTNGNNLRTAITNVASVDNPVITLTAGAIYRMPSSAYQLPNRTGSGYLTIRSSAHASLPSGPTRVFPADAANMAIIEPGTHASNSSLNSAEAVFTAPPGATPAHHYRFLGIHFRKTFSTLDYANPRAFIDLGCCNALTPAELPHHFIIDKCFIDGGNTTAATTRGVAVSAHDVSVVNSYIYRIQGPSLELQTIWVGMGNRHAVINNFLQATTENFMSGGSDVSIRLTQATAQGGTSTTIQLASSEPSSNDFYTGKGIYLQSGTGAAPAQFGRVITAYDGATRTATVDPAWAVTPDSTSVYRIGEHVPSDLVFRRNHLPKDLGWRSGSGTYYGVNMSVKNLFEIKQYDRASIQGNLLEDHWMEDQNWAVVLTVKNQDGKQPWSKFSYIDFAHNKMLRVGNCFQVLISDWANPSLGTETMLVRHNICSGVSFYDGGTGFQNFAVMQDSNVAGTDLRRGFRVSFVRNSTDARGTDGKGRLFMFETSTNYRVFTIYGGIGQGLFTQNGPTGTAALVAGTGGGSGSYSVTKNGFYLASGTNPADNTTISDRPDVKYTDFTNHNLKLANDSPFLTTGPAGGRAGADTDAVDAMTSGTVTGVWNDGTQICQWHTNPACN